MSHLKGWSEEDEMGALRIDTIYEIFDLPRSQDPTD
jgi:hypothetical protein